MNSHPLAPVGNFITFAALVLSGVLGYSAKPAITSILIGSVIFSIGYVLARLPQMIGLYHSERRRILLLPVYLIVGNSILSGIVYGIGRLFS